ncbi:carboxyl transferase domain-containing protein [Pseudomonas sp. CCI3.2]|uniref:acetyl-CoA carboxylase family protein n=1 Tax=unclassified Pseudomonas TaxID=196821 RepID=UPI002AC9D599|nr:MULTISPECIES: carboxyl transferase domain-containing protein [unclassified Pseudomonas]MEB0076428.1 carboxyl transferase domain-containing protein [Pseudomonas sp. MH10out]MEB0091223.1 carboxyl transferase domain-containing protein [Pseudomonas sp. CCI4.2]MEB0100823.1 carboxyl transferase domain-containing protein [Pseudomonas sp. CCI3.2]MEB0128792.1 carboxyl transferase domain-containing protein [Pseudomonas sp. CCI2.4]MEB0156981.1 carboxyl transferase domain-containing protein [Pseudomona
MNPDAMRCLLIANRGEIAIRIARAAAEMGIRSVAVYAEDDATSLHCQKADVAVALNGRGAAAYLDQQQLIDLALANGCDALHPGYGFLSENPAFARLCLEAGICFVGPTPDTLALFGDKTQARALAQRCGVPLAQGSNRATTLKEAEAFLAHGPIMLKALVGGGGRGMRVVHQPGELAQAFERCQSEARSAFGSDALYVERLIENARHIEVQVLGDGERVVHLWERDCSLQRRQQKVIEIAPSPGLDPLLRQRILDAALTLASATHYRGVGTFEFLVDDATGEFVFMEANPRIQVEHTITEAITGVDLVQTQLQIAMGATLLELGLTEPVTPRGVAIQLRINLESMQADGSVRASGGVIRVYEPPTGQGIRVDGYGYCGYTSNPGYDSLLAKLIVHGDDYTVALRRAYRAVCEFRLEGVASNIGFLQNLLRRPELASNRLDTRFIERHIGELLNTSASEHRTLFFSSRALPDAPLHTQMTAPAGCLSLSTPSQGVLVCFEVAVGDAIAVGEPIAVLEAMKMEFVVKASHSGIVHTLVIAPGDSVFEGTALLFIEPADVDPGAVFTEESLDLDHLRADLAEVLERHALTGDARRPEAVARRRKTGQRTARENLDHLIDADSFIEYGTLALAAQRRRRSVEDLIQQSPADGLIAGIGTVNAQQFGNEAARCMVIAYDYTVFAGTQGVINHKKTDRMLNLAEQWRLPLILFAEGGGGRPGDTDFVGVAGLDCHTFVGMAKLSGLVPLIGVVSGRCFAGNAALLGCCNVIIATRNASIGMAGPAMIEGGGLGSFRAEDVGPTSVQAPNGVIDVLVEDEAEAVEVAQRYLSYFQGTLSQWACADQRALRQLIPENRLRAYDIRGLIETLADSGSVLELRHQFAPGMLTALIRIEGRAFGLLANNPMHLGGAIDAQSGDKAARFMQLCEAFDLPMVSLCDTPGFMVGPDAEKQATVRHVSRMFVTAASLTVPFFTVVLRKGYGLGAQAMAAGSFHSPLFTLAWPSAEFGAMGLEGAVRLGFAKELAALENLEERQQLFDKMVAKAYQNGKAINMASFLEIDAVIDPQETRRWLTRGVNAVPGKPAAPIDKKRGFVDTW